MAPSTDDLRRRLAERIEGAEVPAAVFAIVGASVQARHQVAAAVAGIRDRWARGEATKDRLVTTARQLQAEAGEAVGDLPNDVQQVLLEVQARAAAVPGQVREQVVDLRDEVARTYDALVLDGERVLTVWRAEQLMNDRVDAVKGLTPGAARAAVAARDVARRAAASPTGQAMGRAGRRTSATRRTPMT